MSVHDGSGGNQYERLPPPGPEHSQGNPEQLVQDSQSTARSLHVQSQQLLMESQVLKDELLMGAESAEQPAEQLSERHDHVKNLTETSRIQLCAKSFILQVYDVLARHSRGRSGQSLHRLDRESLPSKPRVPDLRDAPTDSFVGFERYRDITPIAAKRLNLRFADNSLGNASRAVYFCFGFGCASLILFKASLALWFAGSSFRAFS